MSAVPLLRYSLTWYKIAGGTETSTNNDPIGWEDIQLILERDPKAHCVVELFEAKLLFVGAAYNLLMEAEETDGVDARVDILFEIYVSAASGWETLQLAQVNIAGLADETDSGGVFYKATAPIVQNNAWTKFMSRVNTPVNIQKATDEDGNAVDVLTPKTQSLTSQKIRQFYQGYHPSPINFTLISGTSQAQLDWTDIYHEIEEKFGLTIVETTAPVGKLFKVKRAGSYNFTAIVDLSTGLGPTNEGDDSVPAGYSVNLDINNGGTVVAFTKVNSGVAGVNRRSQFTLNSTQTLQIGDEVRIYIANSGATSAITWLNFYANLLTVQAETIFPDSSCQAFLLHDVGYSIIDRLIGQDSFHRFHSEFFGHTSYTARTYDEIGINFRYALMTGALIRGLGLSNKPIFTSWAEFFDNVDNIFMCGYGQKLIEGELRIVLENRERFYDSGSVSVVFQNVKNVRRTHDVGKLSSLITIGYDNGRIDDYVLDDPQSIVKYTPRFQRSGVELPLRSGLLAAGLAIEVTRRKSEESSKDWRFDNTMAIISIHPTITAGVMVPELDENFSAISDVENPDARYNLRLWPVFNLLRHFPRVLIGLKKYPTSVIKFNGGELNVKAEATMDSASDTLTVSDTPLAQDQDIPVDIELQRKVGALHSDEMLEFNHPLSWTEYKALRDNWDKSFAVSGTASTFDETFDETFEEAAAEENRVFIERVAWKIKDQQGTFKVWKAI